MMSVVLCLAIKLPSDPRALQHSNKKQKVHEMVFSLVRCLLQLLFLACNHYVNVVHL